MIELFTRWIDIADVPIDAEFLHTITFVWFWVLELQFHTRMSAMEVHAVNEPLLDLPIILRRNQVASTQFRIVGIKFVLEGHVLHLSIRTVLD